MLCPGRGRCRFRVAGAWSRWMRPAAPRGSSRALALIAGPHTHRRQRSGAAPRTRSQAPSRSAARRSCGCVPCSRPSEWRCRCSEQRGPEPGQPKQALATARASTLSQPERAHPARRVRGGARSAPRREQRPRAQRGRRGWRRREASLTGEDQRREHGVLGAQAVSLPSTPHSNPDPTSG